MKKNFTFYKDFEMYLQTVCFLLPSTMYVNEEHFEELVENIYASNDAFVQQLARRCN